MPGASAELDDYLTKSVSGSIDEHHKDAHGCHDHGKIILGKEKSLGGPVPASRAQLTAAAALLGPHQKCFLTGGSRFLGEANARRKQPWDLERDKAQARNDVLQSGRASKHATTSVPRPTQRHLAVKLHQGTAPGQQQQHGLQGAGQGMKSVSARHNHRGPLNGPAEPSCDRSVHSPIWSDLPEPPVLRNSWRFGGLKKPLAKQSTQYPPGQGAVAISPKPAVGGKDGWCLPDVPTLPPPGGCNPPAHRSGEKKREGRTAERGQGESYMTGGSTDTDHDQQNHSAALDAACGRRVREQTHSHDHQMFGSLLSAAARGSGSCEDSSSPLPNLQLFATEEFTYSWCDASGGSSRADRIASPSLRLAGGTKPTAPVDQTPELFGRLREQWSTFCDRNSSSAACSPRLSGSPSATAVFRSVEIHNSTTERSDVALDTAILTQSANCSEEYREKPSERLRSENRASQMGEPVCITFAEPTLASVASPSLLGRKRKQPPQHPLSESKAVDGSPSLACGMKPGVSFIDAQQVQCAVGGGEQQSADNSQMLHAAYTMQNQARIPPRQGGRCDDGDSRARKSYSLSSSTRSSSRSSSVHSDGSGLCVRSLTATVASPTTASAHALLSEAGAHETAVEKLHRRLEGATGQHERALRHLQDDIERFRSFSSFDSAIGNKAPHQQAAGRGGADIHLDTTAKLNSIRLRMEALELATAALSKRTTQPLQTAGKPSVAANKTAARLFDLAGQGLQLNSSPTDSIKA